MLVNNHIIKNSARESSYVKQSLVNEIAMHLKQNESSYRVELGYCMKDYDGKIIAGINAVMRGRYSVEIGELWVSEEHRHKGIGTKLLECLEEECLDNGVRLFYLYTYDFQARDFYKLFGYKVYAKLPNNPIESVMTFFMKKQL